MVIYTIPLWTDVGAVSDAVFSSKMVGARAKLLKYAKILTRDTLYDAEDLLQDSFIKAWTNRHKYRSDINFNGWVYRIMYRENITFVRRQNSSHLITEDINDVFVDGVHGESDYLPYLMEAITELSAVQQQIIGLRMEGFNSNEIAERVGLNYHTVRWHITAINKYLLPRTRELYEDDVKLR